MKNEALMLQRREALEETRPRRERIIRDTREYMARTGIGETDLARRINYGRSTLNLFLSDQYHHVATNDGLICTALEDFMRAHPVMAQTRAFGELYDTANVRLIRDTFERLLPRPVAYMLYAPPGSQKTFALEHEVCELNRRELPKNGHGRRAFYVYARQNIRPQDLMKRIATACGTPATGGIDRILNNLSFDFQTRRVVLVIDEAQRLEIECFEIIRELLDRPPHFSLLLAGSHDLKLRFDKFSATLEQWNSRIVAKVHLPGLLREEAEGIIRREIGGILSDKSEARVSGLIDSLIHKATVKDAFEKNRTYINVRTLTNALDQIKTAAAEASAIPAQEAGQA